MSFDLSNFALGDMLQCGLELRGRLRETTTMEAAAEAAVRYFYDACRDPATARRQCALVRFYKTHPYGGLNPALQHFAAERVEGGSPDADTKCLTLLATMGDQASWRSRHRSRGHQAIPLASPSVVEQAPMIAQLLREFGLDIATVLRPSPQVVRELGGKTYGIFHVEQAVGSPYIPAQEEFVIQHGISSVLGFGGSLPTGDLFAVILFSRVRVPRESADRFRNIALDVKTAVFSLDGDRVFQM